MDLSNLSQSDILSAALALPEASRRELAEEIFHSIKPAGVWSLQDPRWGDELRDRSQAIKSGEDPGVDAEDMVLEARTRIQTARRQQEQA